MRVQWKPTTFGLQAKPGWLVFFDGSLVASIYASDDGTVGLQWGYENPWICASMTWESLEAAKAEFKAWATAYGRGMPPDQSRELLRRLGKSIEGGNHV
jgi:hypothetical protein